MEIISQPATTVLQPRFSCAGCGKIMKVLFRMVANNGHSLILSADGFGVPALHLAAKSDNNQDMLSF